jgi:hypothetical protein
VCRHELEARSWEVHLNVSRQRVGAPDDDLLRATGDQLARDGIAPAESGVTVTESPSAQPDGSFAPVSKPGAAEQELAAVLEQLGQPGEMRMQPLSSCNRLELFTGPLARPHEAVLPSFPRQSAKGT